MAAEYTKRFVALGQMFFVYDHSVVVKEEDDPKDAIAYFYPPRVPVETQCLVSGQLMGMVNFLKILCGSEPKVYKLRKMKVTTKHEGVFTLALAHDWRTPDTIATERMESLYRIFALYHGSLSRLLEHCNGDRARFSSQMSSIWNCYLPYVRCYSNDLKAIFHAVPTVDIPKSHGFIFLKCSHLLQWLKRKPWLLAGCLFYKGKVVCTQLTSDLTGRLLLTRPSQSHFRGEKIPTSFKLQFGVKLLSVYLCEDEYRLFAKQDGGASASRSDQGTPAGGTTSPGGRCSVRGEQKSTQLGTEDDVDASSRPRDSREWTDIDTSLGSSSENSEESNGESGGEVDKVCEDHREEDNGLNWTASEERTMKGSPSDGAMASESDTIANLPCERNGITSDDNIDGGTSYKSDVIQHKEGNTEQQVRLGVTADQDLHCQSEIKVENASVCDPVPCSNSLDANSEKHANGAESGSTGTKLEASSSGCSHATADYKTSQEHASDVRNGNVTDEDIKGNPEGAIEEETSLGSHYESNSDLADSQDPVAMSHEESCEEPLPLIEVNGNRVIQKDKVIHAVGGTNGVVVVASEPERGELRTGSLPPKVVVNEDSGVLDDEPFEIHINPLDSESSPEHSDSSGHAKLATVNRRLKTVQDDDESFYEEEDATGVSKETRGRVNGMVTIRLDDTGAGPCSSNANHSVSSVSQGCDCDGSGSLSRLPGADSSIATEHTADSGYHSFSPKEPDRTLGDFTSKELPQPRKASVNLQGGDSRHVGTEDGRPGQMHSNTLLGINGQLHDALSSLPVVMETDDTGRHLQGGDSSEEGASRKSGLQPPSQLGLPSTKSPKVVEKDKKKVEGMVNVALYIQAHSDMVLVVLAEKELTEDMNILLNMWQSCVIKLAELELELQPVLGDKSIKQEQDQSYNFLQFSPFEKSVKSNVSGVQTQQNRDFVNLVETMHDVFSTDENIDQLVVRGQHSTVLGLQNVSHQTFFQPLRPSQSAASSAPSANHSSGGNYGASPSSSSSSSSPSPYPSNFRQAKIESQVERLLFRDHGIRLL
ncbi:uncharacterized protein [Diadema antillarum]|uniref:uncharacterized protein n=1 Tax=Diadema antillarum TaxID=105358 RepID=UPI003A87A5B8